MSNGRYPPGWDEDRVERVLDHYEKQSAEEAVAEDEAALSEPGHTVVPVPNPLLPAVRDLIAQHEADGGSV